jgi:hypothetical protein
MTLTRLRLEVEHHTFFGGALLVLLQNPALVHLQDLDLGSEGGLHDAEDALGRLVTHFEAMGQACGLKRLRLHLLNYDGEEIEAIQLVWALSRGAHLPRRPSVTAQVLSGR